MSPGSLTTPLHGPGKSTPLPGSFAVRPSTLLTRFLRGAAALLLMAACAAAQSTVLYVSYAGGDIEMFDTATGLSLGIAARGLSTPTGLAIDIEGNVYVSNRDSNVITKVTPNGTTTDFAVGGGLNSPQGLAFDAGGNLYAANVGDNTISKITPAGTVSTFATGLNRPYGITFDASGNLYAANYFDSTIAKIDPNGVVTTFARGGGLTSPVGLVFDVGSGLLYAANGQGDSISSITLGGAVSPLAGGSGLSFPMGMSIDAAGNLFVANVGATTISKVSRNGQVSLFAQANGGPMFTAVTPAQRTTVTAVPEPGVAGLVSAGLLAFGCARRRQRNGPAAGGA